LEGTEGLELVSFEFEDGTDGIEVQVAVHAPTMLTEADANRLREALENASGKPTRLRLLSLPVTEIEVSGD
jgi:hypothetical protein